MTRKSDRGRRRSRGLEEAARRFQESVEDLAASATEEMSDRAAASLDDATAWLRGDRPGSGRREPDDVGVEVDVDDADLGRRQRDRRGAARSALRNRARAYRDHEQIERRSRKLYLDDDNGKIVGVCGGIANYFGMEAWVVRVIAVTGLIFMPSIVFPAYWVAWFVMDHAPGGKQERKGGKGSKGRRSRRNRGDAPEATAGPAQDRTEAYHSAPAPEIGVRLSPRRSLRAAQDDFVELELRLRRIETHVTSGQFELQRELHKIAD